MWDRLLNWPGTEVPSEMARRSKYPEVFFVCEEGSTSWATLKVIQKGIKALEEKK